MSYQPRSTNPYIMEKKLNECVGGGGFNPSVLEEIEAEISVLGSENAAMAQDIIDIKGSLNSISDNLDKHAINENTKITLPYNTVYTTLVDGYFLIRVIASGNNYVRGYVDGIQLIRGTYIPGADVGLYNSIFVRKGTNIYYNGNDATYVDGYFYPLV